MTSSPDEPSSQPIAKPLEHDVILGRGGLSNHHKGNIWYRRLIKENRLYYKISPRHKKLLIAKEIATYVTSKDPPGRFLERRSDTGLWFEVTFRRAVDKTSQALRERDRDVDEAMAQQQETEANDALQVAINATLQRQQPQQNNQQKEENHSSSSSTTTTASSSSSSSSPSASASGDTGNGSVSGSGTGGRSGSKGKSQNSARRKGDHSGATDEHELTKGKGSRSIINNDLTKNSVAVAVAAMVGKSKPNKKWRIAEERNGSEKAELCSRDAVVDPSALSGGTNSTPANFLPLDEAPPPPLGLSHLPKPLLGATSSLFSFRGGGGARSSNKKRRIDEIDTSSMDPQPSQLLERSSTGSFLKTLFGGGGGETTNNSTAGASGSRHSGPKATAPSRRRQPHENDSDDASEDTFEAPAPVLSRLTSQVSDFLFSLMPPSNGGNDKEEPTTASLPTDAAVDLIRKVERDQQSSSPVVSPHVASGDMLRPNHLNQGMQVVFEPNPLPNMIPAAPIGTSAQQEQPQRPHFSMLGERRHRQPRSALELFLHHQQLLEAQHQRLREQEPPIAEISFGGGPNSAPSHFQQGHEQQRELAQVATEQAMIPQLMKLLEMRQQELKRKQRQLAPRLRQRQQPGRLAVPPPSLKQSASNTLAQLAAAPTQLFSSLSNLFQRNEPATKTPDFKQPPPPPPPHHHQQLSENGQRRGSTTSSVDSIGIPGTRMPLKFGNTPGASHRVPTTTNTTGASGMDMESTDSPPSPVSLLLGLKQQEKERQHHDEPQPVAKFGTRRARESLLDEDDDDDDDDDPRGGATTMEKCDVPEASIQAPQPPIHSRLLLRS